MAVYRVDSTFDPSLFSGASCAFGVFDGFHIGHRYLVEQAVATCDAAGKALAVTFDIDPDEVFRPDRLKKLMRNEDRIEVLAQSGVDDVVVLPFTSELRSSEPADFLAAAFPAGVPAHLHVGEDFRFGAKAAGTVKTLEEWGEREGCCIHAHHLVSADGQPITSTRIRSLLLDCAVAEAAGLLGHPYALSGVVQRGRGEGADMGFATANLLVEPHERVLGEGVYGAYALIEGTRYKAAVSVGVSPTFEATSTANVEVHVLDFSGDLVGKRIEVEFAEYLRGMLKFESTDELIATVKSDIEHVRNCL